MSVLRSPAYQGHTFNLPEEFAQVVEATRITIPASRDELLDLCFGNTGESEFDVNYDVPGRGVVTEAHVTRCKNGVSINYPEPYMRRRDPEAMLIADSLPTDKRRFQDRFDIPFDGVRKDTFSWLSEQDALIAMPFRSGDQENGYPSLVVAPVNAGFFVTALADLQGFIPAGDVPDGFKPEAIILVAPPFRHTHFGGRQVVVHNRNEQVHELFAYNLYPGPSAKKGVYGVLLARGEAEGWATLHSSAVRLVTPYDNEFVIMHEGASGGGKSEMTQQLHRENDGRVLLASDTVTGDELFIEMADTCELHPVTDDMALAPPSLQDNRGKLIAEDAEAGWFLRVDHLSQYGTEPYLERLTISPPKPLLFLNIDGKPGATALPWEHTLDEPGKPCPNPRIVMPRHFVRDTVNEPVQVDVRSFGVRTPPCTYDNPNYGIIGILHILPPALAWLWRLVAPRGHSNPSITNTSGLSSEGVGSYWPFATGTIARHANILLDQIQASPQTRYALIPNQYVGAFHVGFKGEWMAREYMARRGGVKYRDGQLKPARCPLLGYPVPSLRINGQRIPKGLLNVHEQIEVGEHGYDAGAKILGDFFRAELTPYRNRDLGELAGRIIEASLDGASVEQYESLL